MALLQIELDAAVLIEEVDAHLRPGGEHAGGEGARRIALNAASKEHRDDGWPANADVVSDQGLKEGARVAWCAQDEGARDFDLAHAEVPPVPSQPISAR